MLGALGGFQGGAVDLTQFITINQVVGSIIVPGRFPLVGGIPTFTDFSDQRYWIPCRPGSANGTPAGAMSFLAVSGFLQMSGGAPNAQNLNGRCGVLGRFNIIPDAITARIIVEITLAGVFHRITFGTDAAAAQYYGMWLYASEVNAYGAGVFVTTSGGTNNNRIGQWSITDANNTVSIIAPGTSLGAGLDLPNTGSIIELTWGDATNGGAFWSSTQQIRHNTDGAGYVVCGGGTAASPQFRALTLRPFLGMMENGRSSTNTIVINKFRVIEGQCV